MKRKENGEENIDRNKMIKFDGLELWKILPRKLFLYMSEFFRIDDLLRLKKVCRFFASFDYASHIEKRKKLFKISHNITLNYFR